MPGAPEICVINIYIMNNLIIDQILLSVAVLTAGIVYGTDGFHAIAGKKALSKSKDSSIADVVGHTHYVADKRMPVIGITSLISTALFILINRTNTVLVVLSATALTMLLAHLALYLTIAKPVNTQMTAAAIDGIVPSNIRELQKRWDSAIFYRAAFLTLAMLSLLLAAMNL